MRARTIALTASGLAAVALAGAAAATWPGGSDDSRAATELGPADAIPVETTTTNAPLDGRSLFAAKGCATCHTGPDGPAAFGDFAPPLAGLAARSDLADPRAYVIESILAPAAVIATGGTGGGPVDAMPALEVTPAEAAVIADYLLAD